MQAWPVALVVLMLAGNLALMCFGSCVTDETTYVCTSVPRSFPSGMSSVVIFVNNMGEINSTVFSSDSLASVSSFTMANGITVIQPRALHSFSQLKRLNLNLNNLSEFSASWFQHPGSVENIVLFGNRLKALNPSTFEDFTGLRSLNLSQNSIDMISLGSFKSLGSLIQLDLSFNMLTYISPEVFRPVHSVRVQLDHNPWDCSCVSEDFIQLIKELVNVSRLERKREVLCATPSHLKGLPVWRVSDCLPTSAPVQNEEKQPGTKQPALIHLLVPLCVTVSAACLLFAISWQKWGRKQIKPSQEVATEGGNLEDPHWGSKMGMNRGKAASQFGRSSWHGARAKSACAVLCTGEFLQQTCGAEDQTAPGKSVLGTEQKGGPPRAPDTGLFEKQNTGHQGTETQSSGTLGGDNGEKSLVSDSTERLPYLSIGPDSAEQSPEPVEHCETKAANKRPIRRMFTWPPTSLQWKKQHDAKREAVNFSSQPAHDSEGQHDMKYGVDDCGQTGFFLGSCQSDLRGNMCIPTQKGNTEDPPDYSYWPTIEEDRLKGKKDYKSHDVVQSANTDGQIQPVHAGTSQLWSGQDQNKWKVARGRQSCSKEQSEKTRSRTKQHPSKRREEENLDHQGRSRFQGLPAHGSPTDNNLLQDNEYTFINLLHEVVQNQGRWTRDRWKQTHLNKQKIKQRSQVP